MRIKQKLVFIQMSLTTYNQKTKEILHTILDKCKISITFEIWCVYFAAKENDKAFHFVLFIISMSQFEILNLQSMFRRIKQNLQYCETFWILGYLKTMDSILIYAFKNHSEVDEGYLAGMPLKRAEWSEPSGVWDTLDLHWNIGCFPSFPFGVIQDWVGRDWSWL